MSEEVWNPEEVLRRWAGQNLVGSAKETIKSHLKPYRSDDYIPIAELETVVLKTAGIVEALGPNYIDLFERAEAELTKAQQDLDTLERIKRIALNYDVHQSNIKNDLIKPSSFLLKAWAIAVSRANILMSH